MAKERASRPATLSFLITTPESGPDSIALTWGLLGPVMALARPLASLFTAVVTGSLALLLMAVLGIGIFFILRRQPT